MTDKILLVENDGVEAINIRQTLEKMGHEVVYIASRWEEAVEKISNLKPDLIIIDITAKDDISNLDLTTDTKNLDLPFIF